MADTPATEKTLTLVAPDGVAPGSLITISDPLPDGTTYKVKGDGTVPDVAQEHYQTYLKEMGFKKQPATSAASTTGDASKADGTSQQAQSTQPQKG